MLNSTPTSLTEDAARGDRVLKLGACNGTGLNLVLQLSNTSQTVLEYGVVDHFTPGAPPGAGQVFLRHALNHSYPWSSTKATFFNASPFGVVANVSPEANLGDGVLLTDQIFNGSNPLVVDFGSLTTEEYHEVGGLTDADGFYGLDGMGRVREIFLFSTQGVLQQTVPWFIEYDHPINVVDLRLS